MIEWAACALSRDETFAGVCSQLPTGKISAEVVAAGRPRPPWAGRKRGKSSVPPRARNAAGSFTQGRPPLN